MGGGRGGRFGSVRGMGAGRGFVGGRASPRTGWEAVDRSKQACVFFAQGKCTKGDACPFSHATSAAGGLSPAPVVGHAPQRAGLSRGRPQLAAADMPPSRLQPATAGPPLSSMTGGKNDGRPRTEASTSGRTNGVNIGSAGLSGQGGGRVSASVAGRNEPGPSSNQDGAYGGRTLATAPAAVVLGASKTHVAGRNGQARATASLNQRQDAPGHTGIIALPGGGFVTRKRAAELQLERDEHSETKPRRLRQRDDREQGRAQQERRSALPPGDRGMPQGGRVSIMDRLGPAKQAPEMAPTKEMIVGPVRTRPVVPVQQAPKREVPRQQTTSFERAVVQTPSLSLMPRSRALGSARPTRRTAGGRGDGVSTSPVARLTAGKQQQKSTALDFKIPSLNEIKSRKAKAEGAAPEATKKREARAEKDCKNGQGLSARKDNKPDRAIPHSFSRAAVVTEVVSPRTSTAVANAEVRISAGVNTPAPVPAVQSNPPQLDAEDMDEFSEWL